MKPIVFLKSFNWGKEDFKKILMLIIMLLIACFILNNFLLVKIKIIQRGYRDSLSIDGEVDANVRGSVNADVSGDIDADVSGTVSTYVSGDIGTYSTY